MKIVKSNSSKRYPNVDAINIEIGEGTVIEKSAVIRGVSGSASRIKIGDNCYIGKNVQIICDDFELGDYSKIHHDTNVHGYKPCKIGHNAWIGQYSIIDSIGGTTIGNNCGLELTLSYGHTSNMGILLKDVDF
jgi:acetyltransferase-like isoleucine patch superfamily enzyme